jgi:hypothetical protein
MRVDEQFLSLLTGVPAIFPVDPTDDGNLNDVEKVMYGRDLEGRHLGGGGCRLQS